MPPERHPKRQRKKEAAEARRQARIAALQRRRRQRIMTLVAITAILVLGGGALAFMATRDTVEDVAGETPEPTPTPAAEPAAIACDGELPPEAGAEKPTYEAPEDQGLAADRTYILRLDTSCGAIEIELAHTRSPETANSIAFLAREGFFDGLTFHRVVPGFVIQGGDPQGDGTGGSGYKVEEAPPDDLTYSRGIVAMAKAGPEAPGTSGSQFFIVTGDDAGLPPEYALLGEVVGGIEVAEEIESFGTGDAPPEQTIYIKTAEIIER